MPIDSAPSTSPATPEPSVKLTQEFKAGDLVIHRAEKSEHKVIAVTPRGVRCTGLAGLINPEILRKK